MGGGGSAGQGRAGRNTKRLLLPPTGPPLAHTAGIAARIAAGSVADAAVLHCGSSKAW